MTKFLFVYRNDPEAQRKLTPEQMREIGPKWQAWFAEGFAKGWLLDAGNGLQPAGCVVRAEKVVTDGPFVETKEVVGGYAIMQAETLAAAAEHAKGCPILLGGGSVEVRPLYIQ